MARPAKTHFHLPDGRLIGASWKNRSGVVRVKFPHPTEPGKYVEASTGIPCKPDWNPSDTSPPPDADIEAAKLIVKAYTPTIAPDPKSTTWEDAVTHLKGTPDLRPDSVRGYLSAVKAVRKVLPHVKSPGELTEQQAHQFKREFLRGTYDRGHASDAKTYGRSATTCTSYLRSLRSLWKAHWRPAGFVRANPWLEVPYPNEVKAKRVRVPEEDNVNELLKWLDAKFPEWPAPALFVRVKLLAACGTLDLSKAKTEDLEGDTLTLSGLASKTRRTRDVPLTPDVARQLRDTAGKVWLWERTVQDSKVHHPAVRTHSQTADRPETWRNTIQNLFREFNSTGPVKKRVRPHDLRARGITLVAAATQSVDQTADMLGLDPQTARHYLDAAKAFDGTEVMRRAAELLRPK